MKLLRAKTAFSGSWLLVVAIFLVLLWPSSVAADTMTNRSVTIQTALTNATTAHQFKFDYASATNVGSVTFDYCDNSPLEEDPCTAPAGLDVSNVTLTSQSGQTGFSIHPNTNTNRVVISRLPLSVSPGPASYTFNNAVNASAPNDTIFVRINTYTSTDGTGSSIDRGAVAFSLSSGLAVSAYVPPFLSLCTGVTVAVNCSTAVGLGVNLGTLSALQASAGTSQAAAATNDVTGYSLSVLGTTMTSGNNTIPALTAPTISSPATGQFGINLRRNTVPGKGHDREGGGTAAPTADYNQANLFKFNSGDTIAAASTSTDFNRFTITYLVNIPFGQAPGVYSTTLTYVAVASF